MYLTVNNRRFVYLKKNILRTFRYLHATSSGCDSPGKLCSKTSETSKLLLTVMPAVWLRRGNMFWFPRFSYVAGKAQKALKTRANGKPKRLFVILNGFFF